jgi:hypothetical protein
MLDLTLLVPLLLLVAVLVVGTITTANISSSSSLKEAVGEDVEEVMATMEDMEATIWEVVEELLLHGKACTMMSLNLVASTALVVLAEALILNMRHQPTRPPAPRTPVSQEPTTVVADEEGTAGSTLTLDRGRDRVGP